MTYVTHYSVLLLLLWFLCPAHSQTIAQVNSLSTTLMTGYNKNTRPVNDQTQTVQVEVNMILAAIRDFDEVLGKLSTDIVFTLFWTDESMVWDPSTNNGVTTVRVSQADVWKPLVTLANPFDELKELGDRNWVTVTILSDGTIMWSPFASLDTTCSIDTSYYPYDRQTCKIEMYVFGYDEDEVNLTSPTAALDLSYYEGNAAWDIKSTVIEKTKRNGIVPLMSITIDLERKPDFIVVTFMIPVLVLAVMNPLVFLLPTDSGERVGFSITILLSLSVFMSILADYIPMNADPMSIAAFMLVVLYVCSASMVVLIIVTIKVYFISEDKPVYSFARGFVRICSLKCAKKSKVDDVKIAFEDTNKKGNRNKVTFADKKDLKKAEAGNEQAEEEVTWKDVSAAIDKCCFIFSYFVVGIVIIVFMVILFTKR